MEANLPGLPFFRQFDKRKLGCRMDKTVQLQEVEVQQRDKTLSTNGETKQQ